MSNVVYGKGRAGQLQDGCRCAASVDRSCARGGFGMSATSRCRPSGLVPAIKKLAGEMPADARRVVASHG